MSGTEKDYLADALQAYMTDKDVSLQQIDKESGIGYGTLSNIKQKKWHLVSETMLRRLTAFLKLDHWKLLSTTNYEIIQEMLEEAQEFSRCFGIVGHTGYGKTAALIHYSSRTNNATYMLADMLMTRNAFFTAIQKSLGISSGAGGTEMLNAIVDKLNSLDKPLLVIDDAGKLSDTNLRLIQLIYDRTERRCGIILAGTLYLKERLENGVKRGYMGYEELYRRIGYWQTLFGPTKEEKLEFLEQHGITCMKEVSSHILNTCHNYGALRENITTALRLKDKKQLSAQALAGGGIVHKQQEEVTHG